MLTVRLNDDVELSASIYISRMLSFLRHTCKTHNVRDSEMNDGGDESIMVINII